MTVPVPVSLGDGNGVPATPHLPRIAVTKVGERDVRWLLLFGHARMTKFFPSYAAAKLATVEHLVILCLAALGWHFEDRPPFLISYDDYRTRRNSLQGVAYRDFSAPARRFPCRCCDIGQLDAFLVQYRYLSAF